ncbi:hypothetical protein L1887_53685 [Cichorium endivia]|nr:hypothetical protein L1887_53685 [Cichorium endivia]
MWRVCDTKRADKKSSTAQHSTLRRGDRVSGSVWSSARALLRSALAGRLWDLAGAVRSSKEALTSEHARGRCTRASFPYDGHVRLQTRHPRLLPSSSFAVACVTRLGASADKCCMLDCKLRGPRTQNPIRGASRGESRPAWRIRFERASCESGGE